MTSGMTPASATQAANALYQASVERHDEAAKLKARMAQKKTMLLYGPEGVGKTRLLKELAANHRLALYLGKADNPQNLLMAALEAMVRTQQPGLTIPANYKSLRSTSIKGIVLRLLDQHPFTVLIDHLAGPSRAVTGLIKEMNYHERTPILFAARSPHMEDIGALLPMCADRSERLELKNFSSTIALSFARQAAEDQGLTASNLEESLALMVERVEGNPGAILTMVRMAKLPDYRVGDQIKAHVVYLDYRMGRR